METRPIANAAAPSASWLRCWLRQKGGTAMTTPEQDRIFTPEQKARLRQHLLRLAPPETDLWPAIAPQLAQQPRARRLNRRRLAAVLTAAALLAALLTGAALLRKWAVYDTATGQLTVLTEGEGYAPEGTDEQENPYAAPPRPPAPAPTPLWAGRRRISPAAPRRKCGISITPSPPPS